MQVYTANIDTEEGGKEEQVEIKREGGGREEGGKERKGR